MEDFVQNINHQFYKYALNYDTTDDNIIRKIIHTNTVADLCFQIACHLNLSKKDRELAYLCGILHDIGRFEQWKLYKTYNDKISVDHGDMSYIQCDKFDLSMLDSEDLNVVKLAVKYHTKQYEGNNERIKMFNKIILNADAYANVLNTANGAQRMTVFENGYTDIILEDFCNLKRLWIYSPKTKLDRALMFTACTYYVRIEFLRNQILENNLIDVIAESFYNYFNKEDLIVYKNAIKTLKERFMDKNYLKNVDNDSSVNSKI